jgi:DNA invertase Pin-like site-specific DNA recombinase
VQEHAQPTTAGPAPAAQYVRMSTEHQQYSTENQMDTMRRFAEARRMEIIRTYSDAARSGLNLLAADCMQSSQGSLVEALAGLFSARGMIRSS